MKFRKTQQKNAPKLTNLLQIDQIWIEPRKKLLFNDEFGLNPEIITLQWWQNIYPRSENNEYDRTKTKKWMLDNGCDRMRVILNKSWKDRVYFNIDEN